MNAKRRGRPRAYDAEAALTRALDTFWDQGFAATSLDELSAATGMNRPSLYGAFGDKQALYMTVFERYRALSRTTLARALTHDRPLREGLARVYQAALAIYLSGEIGARGCFMIGTATTDAVSKPEVRAELAAGLHELDDGFEARFRHAVDTGELPAGTDPVALARMAAAVLHTLSIRARAGETREQLEPIIAAGLDMICRKA
jgi:AcrR family transcriptional regulator